MLDLLDRLKSADTWQALQQLFETSVVARKKLTPTVSPLFLAQVRGSPRLRFHRIVPLQRILSRSIAAREAKKERLVNDNNRVRSFEVIAHREVGEEETKEEEEEEFFRGLVSRVWPRNFCQLIFRRGSTRIS